MIKPVKIKLAGEPASYEIKIGTGLLGLCGDWARTALPVEAQKICLVSNKKVFKLYGQQAKNSFENAGFKVFVWLMPDGERHKNLKSLQGLLAFLSENRFSRTDCAVALGGGVAGDLTGFAASVYLRGIPFLQLPTTVVAQIDSSVGGKTAINSNFGKNLIGTFYQPHGVLIDADTLATLPPREFTAGMCEVIKQSAVGGRALFAQTRRFIDSYPAVARREFFRYAAFTDDLTDLIREQVAFKARIVTGDQKESVGRADAKSRKILNFGHTVGHALEKVTQYKYLKHGEAVGYGMLAAGKIGKELDILGQNSLTLLSDVIRSAGTLPELRGLAVDDIYRAIAFDKKSTGGSVTWILLKDIGEPFLADGKTIPASLIKRAIRSILK